MTDEKDHKISRLTAEVSRYKAVYEAAKKEVDAFDGGYGVTVKHLRKAVAAVSGSQGCDHDWQIDDVLIESSVLPDTEVWKCTKCPATKKTAADSSRKSKG